MKNKKDYDTNETLVLEKNGVLLAKVKKGKNYSYQDVSDMAPSYLHEGIYLAPGVKVLDLLKLLKKTDAFFSILLSRCYYDSYMEVFFSGEKAPESNQTGVELYWVLSSSKGEDFQAKSLREEVESEIKKGVNKKVKLSQLDKDLDMEEYLNDEKKKVRKALVDGSYFPSLFEKSYLQGTHFPQCHLYTTLTENQKASEHEPSYKAGDDVFYSMSFFDPLKLLNLDLRFGKATLINDDILSPKRSSSTFCNSSFTLNDLITGFFWELSFHGEPEKTKKQGKELQKRVKEVLEKSTKTK